MAIVDPRALLPRISNGFGWQDNVSTGGQQSARTLTIPVASHSTTITEQAMLADLPSLPTGVTAYIPTEMTFTSNAGGGYQYLLAEKILLGSHDIATNTFTDGSAMPSRTVFNTTTNLSSPIIAEFTTAAAGTSRTVTVTYTNQSGSTGISTGAIGINNSSSIYAGGTFPLAATDYGVRDITAVTSAGTTPSGTMTFWGLIPIIMYQSASTVLVTNVADVINAGVVRRLGANAKLGVFMVGTANQTSLMGSISWVGDN